MDQTKRYLNTDTLTTTLPRHFIQSKNKKYIEIVAVNFFVYDSKIDDEIEGFHQPKFISFHSDLVQDHRELDCHIQMVNTRLTKRKKYEMLSTQDNIEFWFKNINGLRFDKHSLEKRADGFYYYTFPTIPGQNVHELKIKFVIEMLLIY